MLPWRQPICNSPSLQENPFSSAGRCQETQLPIAWLTSPVHENPCVVLQSGPPGHEIHHNSAHTKHIEIILNSLQSLLPIQISLGLLNLYFFLSCAMLF